MFNLSNISGSLLLEQDSKISNLRKAIIDRKPITIQYSGPPGEVLPGPRFHIEPVVMGANAKSGNLVIWAYVFRGTSKKGLPGWKMFRVDRIQAVEPSGLNANSFKLSDLPGYEKGKAPNAMKSLSRVDIYSPYWFEGYKKNQNKPTQPPPPAPERMAPVEVPPQGEPEIPTSPNLSQHRLDIKVFNDLKTKVRETDGQKTITTQDYTTALQDLYNKKEDEWKNYQRMVTGNIKPGEGTRERFQSSSKNELDDLLRQNNITISDNAEPDVNLNEELSRIKHLIFL